MLRAAEQGPLPITLDAGQYAVVAERLTKRYGQRVALNGLDLRVPRGSVYLLIGPNGSGKSTCLRALMDLTRIDHGRARVLDCEIPRESTVARAQIGYVPEGQQWAVPWMKVGDIVSYHAQFYPSWDGRYANDLIARLRIPVHAKLRQLSKGQSRRVHLLLALAHRPLLLMLDEPTDGLDPLALDQMIGILAGHLAESPTTLLLSTHHVGEVESLADHVGVMRDGALVLQASRDDVRRNCREYTIEGDSTAADRLDADCTVLRRRDMGRQCHLVVWGEADAVRASIALSGGWLRAERNLSLSEAAVAVLGYGAPRD